MENSLSSDQVISQIQNIHDNGQSLAKKSIKKQNPELMRNALYYYPSWDSAIKAAGIDSDMTTS